MYQRDTRIDILKFIGILCIILAHTNPPDAIFELRNFDVVLMVLITGTTFSLSHNKDTTYFGYLTKRFRRLIVPTWVFLTIFFVAFIFVSRFTRLTYPFDLDKVIRSYLLIDGIGYVWIMRIYFLTALLLPLLLWFSNKIKKNLVYFLSLTPIYLVYVILIKIGDFLKNELLFDLYQCFVLDVIGWGIIVAIGVRIMNLCTKELVFYTGTFLFSYVAFRYMYGEVSTQIFKYPPQAYYISYGLFVSFALLIILSNKQINKLLGNAAFIYVARNSLWIYLWHIIPAYIIKYFGESMPFITCNYLTKFLFMFSISLLLTSIQNYIFNIKKLRG